MNDDLVGNNMYGINFTIFGLQERIRRASISVLLLRRILREVAKHYPYEICGLLSGRVKGDEAHIMNAVPLTNVKGNGSKFWFDVKEWMIKIIREARAGRTYLGIYHSHPNSSVIPSLNDRHRMLECPEELWLIISYDGVKYSWSLWRIDDSNSSLFKVELKVK
ncbi:MAG: hypothetical protein B6U69_02390 [Thermofilum sp. ex4484_15]|nr:MAG: hypothetical protein B6U69_02390 [Thermofilum sp. ex4484_15]